MNWSAAVCWTTLVKGLSTVALPLALLTCQANADSAGIRLLGPEDSAIAIDLDSVFLGPALNGRYPEAENPPKALDATLGSKYLNFGGVGSGFIVTPSFPAAVESFQITTANDAPDRDPTSWALYGFNGALVTTDSGFTPAINADGLAEAWTLVASGGVVLPDTRTTVGPVVDVIGGGAAFDHYKMIFPTLKSATSIMQIDEIQFFLDDAGTPAQALLTPTDPIIAVDEILSLAAWSGSSYPGGETPALGIDQSRSATAPFAPNTKYLNFGEEKSGIIITNSSGPVQVDSMGLVTANDAVERDPASYELYGTNDPITSADNSNSNGTEVWTLISSGPLTLPDARLDGSTVVPINASAMYTSYRLIFPTVKDATAANSMQISDIQFYTVPEPSTVALVVMAGLAALGCVRRRNG